MNSVKVEITFKITKWEIFKYLIGVFLAAVAFVSVGGFFIWLLSLLMVVLVIAIAIVEVEMGMIKDDLDKLKVIDNFNKVRTM